MKRSTELLEWLVCLVATGGLVWLTAQHHNGFAGLYEELRRDPMDVPLFVTPCLIFGLTISAYYRFVTEYRGIVAALSLLNSLVALALCLMLVESREWWDHLQLIYALFFSYVVWDIWMTNLLQTSVDKDVACVPSEVASHLEEIRTISRLINQPTLVSIFLVWAYTFYMTAAGTSADRLDHYISGVVSFHLFFSSVAYVLTMYHYRRHAIAS